VVSVRNKKEDPMKKRNQSDMKATKKLTGYEKQIEKAYRAVDSIESTDFRAPHGWLGYLWSGHGYTGMDTAWALVRSRLPITRQSAAKMLTAALRGKPIGGMRCMTPVSRWSN